MGNGGVKEGLKGGTAIGAGFVLAITFVVVLLALPRAVAPSEMPALVVDGEDAAAVRARDERLAREALRDHETNALRRLYAEHSLAEIAGADTPDSARHRIMSFVFASRRYRESRGEEAIAALRAEAALEAERALRGDLEDAERDARLGTFFSVLERYGAADAGELRAPSFVVRTLFVSRWNVAHGFPPTDGMQEAELQAYWGWLALEAEDAPDARRLEALEAYDRAGGADADEARGTLLYRMGRMPEAAEAFQRAYEEEGTLRLRNHALAALERSG